MNYLLARNAFLKSIGNPTGEDRLKALTAFDQTFVAQHARFVDAWSAFWESVGKAVGL